jgi:predicted nucleic acid-binding Zn ribbon protein
MTIGHNKPPRSYGELHCPNCGAAFTAAHHRQFFCAAACKTEFKVREQTRGRNLTLLAQAWRGGRSTKNLSAREQAKWAFSELCTLTDRWNAEDRAAGRPIAAAVLARQRATAVRG